jgi:hypothetical protein
VSLQLDLIYCPYAAKSRNRTARDEIVDDYRPFLGEEPFFGDDLHPNHLVSPWLLLQIGDGGDGSGVQTTYEKRSGGRCTHFVASVNKKRSPNRIFFILQKNRWFRQNYGL